ncbi:OLC1v1016617C1 [Oldenlandia corymbosa var. corymbosa]|uniref:OLC1v1016617C1 n=1 Tax=Oldenlandia corymbosa var. corymbosa TaxID=529605 RepID=A0AAV1E7J1_OLDCO|nr:OLC1v1016617C1 [Oldenlandia corymbosa var. corymbosa]
MSNTNYPREVFFFNPFGSTKRNNRIEVSDWPTCHIIALTFPFPPTSSDWSVFGIFHCVQYPDKFTVGRIENGKKPYWTFHFFSNPYKFQVCSNTLAYHNDRYYCLDMKGRLAIFFKDPDGIEMKVTWIDESTGIRFIGLKSRLLNRSFLAPGDDGEIFAAVISHRDPEVPVYKFDYLQTMWIPVENLRDTMLFVSEIASFVAKAPICSHMGNKIYFPKFYRKNGVFYSLHTKKYHLYNGRFVDEKPYRLDNMAMGTWIQPSCLV